jgi:hypothetical protein
LAAPSRQASRIFIIRTWLISHGGNGICPEGHAWSCQNPVDKSVPGPGEEVMDSRKEEEKTYGDTRYGCLIEIVIFILFLGLVAHFILTIIRNAG